MLKVKGKQIWAICLVVCLAASKFFQPHKTLSCHQFEKNSYYLRKMIYYSVTQAPGKKNLRAPKRNRPCDPLVTSLDALPLSYRRVMGTKATKLGSCDKHTAYCKGWNVYMCLCTIRDVTKISSCWVNTTSRQGIKQLGISFVFFFLFCFLMKVKPETTFIVAEGNLCPAPWQRCDG